MTPYPVFFVVGNHDVDEEQFSLSDFERAYGPTNFWLSYRNCLLIFLRMLDDDDYPTDVSLRFMESVLSSERSKHRFAFVFTHIPPPFCSDIHLRGFEGSRRFMEMCDRYKVDYVIAGDYHGYARARVRGTVYLVSGGGGARLRRQKFGRFHHALVIHVEDDRISEKILAVPEAYDLEDKLECVALAEILPWLARNGFAALLINLTVLGLFVAGLVYLRRGHRHDNRR